VDYEIIDNEENTVFFINKNQIHYFCEDSPNNGYLFHFNDIFVNDCNNGLMERFSTSIFNEIGGNHLNLDEENAMRMETHTAYMQSELSQKDFFYKDQVYHYFQGILFQIERLRKKTENTEAVLSEDFKIAANFKKLVFQEINTTLLNWEQMEKH